MYLQITEQVPAFVYFESKIKKAVDKFKKYYSPHGLQIRYLVKANSNRLLITDDATLASIKIVANLQFFMRECRISIYCLKSAKRSERNDGDSGISIRD